MRHITISAVVNDDKQLKRLAGNIAKAIKTIEREFGEAATTEVSFTIAPVFAVTEAISGRPNNDYCDDESYEEE